jgi:hypothetical protein
MSGEYILEKEGDYGDPTTKEGKKAEIPVRLKGDYMSSFTFVFTSEGLMNLIQWASMSRCPQLMI